jgi:ubiquinone biosynthesis protein
MAVVHRAWLHDGTEVAVKVLRPGIEGVVATDVAMMERAARFMAARGIEQGYNTVSLIVGLRAQVAEELNLRNEARSMAVFRGLFEQFDLSLLVVPRVYDEFSAQRVLTMDWLDGAPLDNTEHARALGIDLAPIVRELLKAWVLTAIRVGAFHADIHAGNLLLLRDGRLGMIDWGIVSRMEGEAYVMFRAICEASIGREEAWDEMGDVMLRINGPGLRALGLNDDEIRSFVRKTFEPVLTQPLSEVSMAELMMSGDDVIRKARGTAPPKRTLRDRWRAMRAGGKAYREAAANRAFEDPTMHMSFLSMKQLLYLERYARIYMPDESLLGDGDFVRQVLRVEPAGR